MKNMMRSFYVVLLPIMPMVMISCATSSVFKPYPEQINPIIANLQTGDEEQAIAAFKKKTEKADRALYLMERGRIAHITGNFDASIKDFQEAIECFKEEEKKALISGTEVGANLAALATNDAAIPYEVKSFEKILVYQFQALNYLFSGDLNAAMIEMRRASAEQQYALERHEKALQRAAADLEKAKSNSSEILDAQYAGLDEYAGRVKNSFQNAYTFHTCAIIEEAYARCDPDGGHMELNSAYISYKKALEINPENLFLQRKALQLALELKMDDDYEEMKTRYSLIDENIDSRLNSENSGNLIILYEESFVPQLQAIKIPIPTPNGIISVDFPIYSFDKEEPDLLHVVLGETISLESALCCDMRVLAVKNLKERLPIILAREIVRTGLSAVAQDQAKKKAGIAGAILGSAYELAMRRADLRGFYTLPRYCHVAHVSLPVGTHSLRLISSATGMESDETVSINKGDFCILRVFNLNTRLVVHKAFVENKKEGVEV